jgi:CubicO group peptidase (beta-lactamase class C family)
MRPTFLLLLLPLLAAPLAAQQRSMPAVDSIFANVDKGNSPGCALGVYQDGKLVYAHGYGLANLELGVPITSRSVFDIGSTSKQFTAASLALLSLDGKLSLDDDVRKWVPELPSYGKTITIRHILHHTSGIRDYIGLMVLAGADIDDVTSEQEALDIIVRQKALNFQPGAEYLYSNSGFFLAGIIVKRASGKSLKDFAAERIFQPLGMIHTQFRDDHTEWVADRTTAYSPRAKGDGFVIDMSNWEQVGDGAVVTTVEDLLKWDSNFYLPTVGGTRMVELLQSTTPLTSGKPNDYALGLIMGRYRGLPTVSHGGSWGGYRAELFRIPSLHFSAAVLCNVPTGMPGAAAKRVADVMVGDRLGPVPAGAAKPSQAVPSVTIAPEKLAAWQGTFATANGDVRVFTVEEGRLMLSAWDDQHQVYPIDDTHMVLTAWGDPITYELRPVKNGRRQLLEVDGTDSLTLGALVVAKMTPALLKDYQGAYFGAEVNTTITLSVAGDTLKFERPGSAPLVMRPLERDHFTVDHFSVHFQRQGNRVTGFLLDMGRTRALQFVRTGR